VQDRDQRLQLGVAQPLEPANPETAHALPVR
jgi:hypothetical protein